MDCLRDRGEEGNFVSGNILISSFMKMKYSENIYQDFFLEVLKEQVFWRTSNPLIFSPIYWKMLILTPPQIFGFLKWDPRLVRGGLRTPYNQVKFLPAILESQFFKPWLQNDVLTYVEGSPKKSLYFSFKVSVTRERLDIFIIDYHQPQPNFTESTIRDWQYKRQSKGDGVASWRGPSWFIVGA